MDKTTLKIVGARLRREFAAVDQLPFPLQQALAQLASREAETSATAHGDSSRSEEEPKPDRQRPSTR